MDKTLFEKLYNSLKLHPEEWMEEESDEYVLEHDKTGLGIWVASGADCLCIYRPVKLECFTLWQKIRLWRVAKDIKKRLVVQKKMKNLEILIPLINQL